MSKKMDFDISSITKKLNLSGIVDNVKSIISPTSISIDAKEGDQVGLLLAHLNELVSQVAVEHERQEQRLGQISKTSAQIYALLQQDHVKAPAEEKKDDKQSKAKSDSSEKE
jgi:hypothetical protein